MTDKYSHKLATPQLRALCDPFTHARIIHTYAGFEVWATDDGQSEIHLATKRTRQEAVDFINS
jgi:hypothetical protein